MQPYLDSLAFRIESEEGSVVFAGDTGPAESVLELARGADMLICPCIGAGSVGETPASRVAFGEPDGVDGARALLEEIAARAAELPAPGLGASDAGRLAAEAGAAVLGLARLLRRRAGHPRRARAGTSRRPGGVRRRARRLAEELQQLEVARAHDPAAR